MLEYLFLVSSRWHIHLSMSRSWFKNPTFLFCLTQPWQFWGCPWEKSEGMIHYGLSLPFQKETPLLIGNLTNVCFKLIRHLSPCPFHILPCVYPKCWLCSPSPSYALKCSFQHFLWTFLLPHHFGPLNTGHLT